MGADLSCLRRIHFLVLGSSGMMEKRALETLMSSFHPTVLDRDAWTSDFYILG